MGRVAAGMQRDVAKKRGHLYMIQKSHVYYTYVSLYTIYLFHMCMQRDVVNRGVSYESWIYRG